MCAGWTVEVAGSRAEGDASIVVAAAADGAEGGAFQDALNAADGAEAFRRGGVK